MPIKFRCEHCRQFLGISHTKSGMLVDCPTCGRTIRVPDPEGNVQPLPELKLNIKDSKLATALEELAMFGQNEPAMEPESAVAVAEGEGPTPKPPAAPPLAPVPIRVEPVVVAKPIPIEVHGTRQPVPVASMQELSALASLPTVRDPAAEQPVVDVEMLLGQRGANRVLSKHSGTSWIVIASLLSFIGGFVIGRWDRSSVTVPKSSVGADGKSPDVKTNSSDPVASGKQTVAVRGRITFQTDSGERRPDRGARVLLLPEKRAGTTKLAVTGFRFADADADGQVAAASLRALGGDVAIVDDFGNFESASLKPGTYHILALSHFQPREDRVATEPSVRALLDNYFDKPEQLLGKCRYQLAELKVSGQDAEIWDHLFERE